MGRPPSDRTLVKHVNEVRDVEVDSRVTDVEVISREVGLTVDPPDVIQFNIARGARRAKVYIDRRQVEGFLTDFCATDETRSALMKKWGISPQLGHHLINSHPKAIAAQVRRRIEKEQTARERARAFRQQKDAHDQLVAQLLTEIRDALREAIPLLIEIRDRS